MVEVSPEHEVACFRYGEKAAEGSGKRPEEQEGKAEEERKEGGEGDE
ncbi:hypothetical protein [Hominifimenecus sp. rT4P-3]